MIKKKCKPKKEKENISNEAVKCLELLITNIKKHGIIDGSFTSSQCFEIDERYHGNYIESHIERFPTGIVTTTISFSQDKRK